MKKDLPMAETISETTENYLKMYQTGLTRYHKMLESLKPEQVSHKLHPDSNSIGFLMRHIAEVDQVFANRIFGVEINMQPKTVGPNIKDDGSFTDLEALKTFNEQSEQVLSEAIQQQDADKWTTVIDSPIFGKITKSAALSRIIAHTGYQVGQIGLIAKYGD